MAITKQTLENCEKKNLSLFFNRLSYGAIQEDKTKFLLTLLERMNGIQTPRHWIDQLQERRTKVVDQLEQRKAFSVINFHAKAQSRFLIGTGNPSPYEVGFFFSRNYGLPVIPGTSLKGAFHHFLVEEGMDQAKIDLWMGTGTEGEEGSKGNLIFLDALPMEAVTLEMDLINNHFPEYYGDKKGPPNDVYDPIPVFYLVVAPRTRVRFTILVRQKIGKDEIQTLFEQMLMYKGIGAKTAYGYGRFHGKPPDQKNKESN